MKFDKVLVVFGFCAAGCFLLPGASQASDSGRSQHAGDFHNHGHAVWHHERTRWAGRGWHEAYRHGDYYGGRWMWVIPIAVGAPTGGAPLYYYSGGSLPGYGAAYPYYSGGYDPGYGCSMDYHFSDGYCYPN